jgi:hypothetical protein
LLAPFVFTCAFFFNPYLENALSSRRHWIAMHAQLSTALRLCIRLKIHAGGFEMVVGWLCFGFKCLWVPQLQRCHAVARASPGTSPFATGHSTQPSKSGYCLDHKLMIKVVELRQVLTGLSKTFSTKCSLCRLMKNLLLACIED